VPLDPAELGRHDATVVVTAHDAIDWRLVAGGAPTG
jgi:hypothetical protein